MATTNIPIPAAVNTPGRVQLSVNIQLTPAQALTLRRIYLGMKVELPRATQPRDMNYVIAKLMDIIGAGL